jgi:hypothetical protein
VIALSLPLVFVFVTITIERIDTAPPLINQFNCLRRSPGCAPPHSRLPHQEHDQEEKDKRCGRPGNRRRCPGETGLRSDVVPYPVDIKSSSDAEPGLRQRPEHGKPDARGEIDVEIVTEDSPSGRGRRRVTSPVQGIARLAVGAQDAVQPIALRACGNASGDRPPAAMIPLPSLEEWISPRGFVTDAVPARETGAGTAR